MERWPNFFIVGATKAGTTSLYNYLSVSPEVFLSSVKEPGYFSPRLPEFMNQVVCPRAYAQLFAGAGEAVAVGEASAGYLSMPTAGERIQKKVPDARIIISLRDPVERTFSHYLMKDRVGRARGALRDEFDTIVAGNSADRVFMTYTEKVASYLDRFGPERVRVLIFEEWMNDPNRVTRDLLHFLGVRSTTVDIRPVGARHNPYRRPRGRWAKRIYGNPSLRRLAGVAPAWRELRETAF